LRDLTIRLGLAGVDDIRKLHRVLDEENGNVVTNNVPVALLGVELDGETANITDGICRTTAAQYSRES
jgi:predicted acyl esterase